MLPLFRTTAGAFFLLSPLVLRAAPAPQTVVPEYHQEIYPEISTTDAEAYVTKGGLLFDARDAKAYLHGHLPGARFLPPASGFDEAYARVRPALEADKSQPIVVYCTNRWCPLSDALYHKLKALGYTQVTVFRDGFDGWQQMKLPVIVSTSDKN